MACPAFHSSSKILVLVKKGRREFWTGELFTNEASKKITKQISGKKKHRFEKNMVKTVKWRGNNRFVARRKEAEKGGRHTGGRGRRLGPQRRRRGSLPRGLEM